MKLDIYHNINILKIEFKILYLNWIKILAILSVVF